MSTPPTLHALRRVGRLITVAGTVFVAVGAAAWSVITSQLKAEKITVPPNAPAFAGRQVQDPATAFVEAQVIKSNAEHGSDGRTFADISDALRTVEKGSDEEKRLRGQSAALSTAASLRTSLMTSVLAYGVSALVAGLGALFLLVGGQLRRVG
ncbi:MAG: aromatic ring-opening dioxygenase LigA [Microbacterium sp.]